MRFIQVQQTDWEQLQRRVVCKLIVHGKAMYKKKHHYYTAGAISLLLFVFGMSDVHHHLIHWVYAVCETFVDGGEGL